MTQPCHKDTTLNQQCCDSKHKTEEESRAQFHHRTSPPTTNTTPQDRRGMRTIRGEQTMRRGARQHEMPYPIRTRDNTQPTPRHSMRPPRTQDGGHQHADGGHRTQDRGGHQHSRPSLTMPPTIRYATPPSTTAPPTTTTRGGAHRGYPTTRTPHTRTPHTTHHTPGKEQCTT